MLHLNPSPLILSPAVGFHLISNNQSSTATMASIQPDAETTATGLTTVFTPRTACLSTYIFDSWVPAGLNGEDTNITDVFGVFRFKKSVFSDSSTSPCSPQGGMLSGTPSFSPGLSCPFSWAIYATHNEGERTTGLCCPV